MLNELVDMLSRRNRKGRKDIFKGDYGVFVSETTIDSSIAPLAVSLRKKHRGKIIATKDVYKEVYFGLDSLSYLTLQDKVFEGYRIPVDEERLKGLPFREMPGTVISAKTYIHPNDRLIAKEKGIHFFCCMIFAAVRVPVYQRLLNPFRFFKTALPGIVLQNDGCKRPGKCSRSRYCTGYRVFFKVGAYEQKLRVGKPE